MANLNNTYADSLTGYKGILNLGSAVGLNLTSSLQYISDGMGNASTVYISTTQVGVNNNNLAVTQDITKGLYIFNETAASLAVPVQISPATMYVGSAWKSDVTAASRLVGFRTYTVPITGTSAVTGSLIIQSSVDGALASWATKLTLSSDGSIIVAGLIMDGNIYPSSSASQWSLFNDGGGTAQIALYGATNGTAALRGNILFKTATLIYIGAANDVAYPALKRSGTDIQIRTGTDSAYAGIDAGTYKVGGVAGSSYNGLLAGITNITIVNGIVTATS